MWLLYRFLLLIFIFLFLCVIIIGRWVLYIINLVNFKYFKNTIMLLECVCQNKKNRKIEGKIECEIYWNLYLSFWIKREIVPVSEKSVYKFQMLRDSRSFYATLVTMLLTSCTRSRVYYVRNYRGRIWASCFIRRENEGRNWRRTKTWTNWAAPTTNRFNCS